MSIQTSSAAARKMRLDIRNKRKEAAEKQKKEKKNLENIFVHQLDIVNQVNVTLQAINPPLKRCIASFRCPLCVRTYPAESGVVLLQCSHRFCEPCLQEAVRNSEFSDVNCPINCIAKCGGKLTKEELQALMTPAELEQLWLKKCLKAFYCEKCSQTFDTPLVLLKACNHEVCRDCIVAKIMSSETGIVSCSKDDCNSLMKDAEIRSLLDAEQSKIYEQTRLNETDRVQVVTNMDPFDCSICMTSCTVGEGIMLRECLHEFCKNCLMHLIEHSTEIIVKCPYVNDQLSGCDGFVQEREIRGILSEAQMQIYTNRMHILSLNMVPNAFACTTVNCKGYWIAEPNDLTFNCVFCKCENCLKCKAIHTGLTCGQFEEARSGLTEKSQMLIKGMIEKGSAMKCPQCDAVVTKQSGCDAVVCLFCRTELCWATKGRRWGLGGKNDISGGCRCGVNKVLCHPNCRNCH